MVASQIKLLTLLIEGICFSRSKAQVMKLANSLYNMNAISEDSFKCLNKTFHLFDVLKDFIYSDAEN
jgi:hypothetical protein